MSAHDKTIHARFVLRRPGSEKDAFRLDVDVRLPGRGISAIFGPSGSGKTTFLRCAAGLETPDDGYLSVNGDIWQSESGFVPTHKRPLGYVFQESSLFAHLTAQGNLAYAVKRAGSRVSAEVYEQVIGIMELAPLLKRFPEQLSGGERQRVAIARALVIQPRLLLMDEPLASLDAARKQEILPYLERLRTAFDMPILYVSHAMDEVARLADHAVVLERGRVAAEGSLTDVFSRIDSPLRAEETSVILEGRVAERDGAWHLSRIALAGGRELWVRDGGDALDHPVRIRVLARDVSLALASHDDSSILNRLRADVAEVAEDQDEAMALVRLKAGDDFLIARITRRSLDHLQLAPGKTVWAQVKSAAIVR